MDFIIQLYIIEFYYMIVYLTYMITIYICLSEFSDGISSEYAMQYL